MRHETSKRYTLIPADSTVQNSSVTPWSQSWLRLWSTTWFGRTPFFLQQQHKSSISIKQAECPKRLMIEIRDISRIVEILDFCDGFVFTAHIFGEPKIATFEKSKSLNAKVSRNNLKTYKTDNKENSSVWKHELSEGLPWFGLRMRLKSRRFLRPVIARFITTRLLELFKTFDFQMEKIIRLYRTNINQKHNPFMQKTRQTNMLVANSWCFRNLGMKVAMASRCQIPTTQFWYWTFTNRTGY